MKKIQRVLFALILIAVLAISTPVYAQDYYFQVTALTSDVYINEDGTATIEYLITFQNDPAGHAIDYVDIGMPNSNYAMDSITATIDDKPITDIEDSPYVEYGFALGLGQNAIPAGESGTVYVRIGVVNDMLFVASADETEKYASFNFSPTWFDGTYSYGNTEMTVTLHLPPAVTDQEPQPRYIEPKKWPGESVPLAGYDDENRIVYQWTTTQANPYTQYTFGATFPARYVAESAISEDMVVTFDSQKIWDVLIPVLCCGGFLALVVILIVVALKASKKRKLKYLPPKISVEGLGIKRGLTPVEVGILMEQPMDKILTMILFSTMQKEAAQIVTREPLEIKVEETLPEDLRQYEKDFLEAFRLKDARERTKALQDMMVNLVKGVSEKMKGFSRKETLDYYKDIMKKAWEQVEAADTPEVRGERYQEQMDWTLLDSDYDQRTRRVFGSGPVFMPWWWWRADPSMPRTGSSVSSGTRTASASSDSHGGGSSMTTVRIPHLAGSEAAASVVGTVQSFSTNVVGNLTSFTDKITNKTNPIPQSTTSGRSFHSTSGGGRPSGGCACACACAGCACACAGGGR
jgi:hypothetical protein